MNKPQSDDYEDFLDDPMLDESSPDPYADLPDDDDECGEEQPPEIGDAGLTAQQKAYTHEAKRHAEAERQCMKAVRQCLEQLTQADPALIKYGVRLQNRLLYRKAPPGFSRIVPAIADRLSWKGWAASKTQAEILADVQASFPEYPKLSMNIWAKEQPAGVLKRIRERFKGCVNSVVDLSDCKSLSDIKRAVTAAEKAANAEQVFKATIAITSDAVVVNDTTYPIEQRTAGEYTYPSIRLTVDDKRAWVRVAHLLAVLKGN